MKLDEDRKAKRAFVMTIILVLLSLAIATFGAYFFGRRLMGRW